MTNVSQVLYTKYSINPSDFYNSMRYLGWMFPFKDENLQYKRVTKFSFVMNQLSLRGIPTCLQGSQLILLPEKLQGQHSSTYAVPEEPRVIPFSSWMSGRVFFQEYLC